MLRVGREKEGNGERVRELKRSEKQRMDEAVNVIDTGGEHCRPSAIICELWELMKCTPGVNRESNFHLLGRYRVFHFEFGLVVVDRFSIIFSRSFSPVDFQHHSPPSLYHALIQRVTDTTQTRRQSRTSKAIYASHYLANYTITHNYPTNYANYLLSF